MKGQPALRGTCWLQDPLTGSSFLNLRVKWVRSDVIMCAATFLQPDFCSPWYPTSLGYTTWGSTSLNPPPSMPQRLQSTWPQPWGAISQLDRRRRIEATDPKLGHTRETPQAASPPAVVFSMQVCQVFLAIRVAGTGILTSVQGCLGCGWCANPSPFGDWWIWSNLGQTCKVAPAGELQTSDHPPTQLGDRTDAFGLWLGEGRGTGKFAVENHV